MFEMIKNAGTLTKVAVVGGTILVGGAATALVKLAPKKKGLPKGYEDSVMDVMEDLNNKEDAVEEK